MTNINQELPQLVRFWTKLFALKQKIDDQVIPLAYYLGTGQEDPELIYALEQCSEKIGEHLSQFKVSAERKSKSNEPIT